MQRDRERRGAPSAIFAEALSNAAARSDAMRLAEARRASCVITPISEVDVAWAEGLRASTSASREQLLQLKQDLRSAPEGAELDEVILTRDAARHAHVNLLARVLEEHEGRCIPLRVDALREEAESLQEDLLGAPPQAVLVGSMLTKRLRLTKLRGPSTAAPRLLIKLSEWEKEAAHMRAELEDLRPHAGGQAPCLKDLRQLHQTWEVALDELIDAKADQNKRRPPPDAEEKVRSARRAVQTAERELRHARVRLAALASAHFPELFAREPLLRLGTGADGDVLEEVLVERELDHYSGPDGGGAKSHMLSAPNARHRVYRREPRTAAHQHIRADARL